MKNPLEQLTSLERRFVVAVVVVLFLVLNVLFVWPRFSDWGKTEVRMAKARKTLTEFQTEIAQAANLGSQIKELESEGATVPPEDQAIEFLRAIQQQAIQSGVQIIGNARQPARTNQWFLEQAQSVTFAAEESQLVDFLYRLGSGNSLIRVRDLSLRPDPPRNKLTGNLKLVASYQKKPAAPARVGGAPAPVVPPRPSAAAPAPVPSKES